MEERLNRLTDKSKFAICARIATEVMREPMPDKPPRNMYDTSEGNNWYGYWVEGTDYYDPTYAWAPRPFTSGIAWATIAFDAYFGDDSTLLSERYRNKQAGELTWMAYWGMKYGYGHSLPMAICDLLLAHVDDEDDGAWERWSDDEDHDLSEFSASSFVFRKGYENELMRKGVREAVDKHDKDGTLVGVTVVSRNERGEAG